MHATLSQWGPLSGAVGSLPFSSASILLKAPFMLSMLFARRLARLIGVMLITTRHV